MMALADFEDPGKSIQGGIEMKGVTLAAGIVCLGVFACSTAKATLYQFTTLDFPGAPSTVARGINDAGTIVGNTNANPLTAEGGFIFSDGNYSALSVPPGTPNARGPLSANGINNSGDITGGYQVISPPPPPFLFGPYAYILSGSTLTQVSFETGPVRFPTGGFGINSADTITGRFSGPTASTSGLAFTFSDGVFQFLVPTPPLAPFEMYPSTVAYGINDSNHIVGMYFTGPSARTIGFLCAGLSCTGATVIAYPGSNRTVPHGINNADDIVGTYSLNGLDHGFVDIGGVFQTLDDPDATGGTIAWGINNLGQIVGQYDDPTGTHGFLATPLAAVPEPASALLLGMGLAGLAALSRRRA